MSLIDKLLGRESASQRELDELQDTIDQLAHSQDPEVLRAAAGSLDEYADKYESNWMNRIFGNVDGVRILAKAFRDKADALEAGQ